LLVIYVFLDMINVPKVEHVKTIYLQPVYMININTS